MITINMARACCGVLGNVSLRSTIHTLAWDTGPARCDPALVYDAELWNPWVSLLTIGCPNLKSGTQPAHSQLA